MDHTQEKDQNNVLEVQDLKTHFFTREGVVKAVNGVTFSVRPGEILGLVGESGSGKSATSLSIMRLVGPPGRIIDGSIRLNGLNLLELDESEMVHVRGNKISIIFQQPQASLDPVYRVGAQVSEALRAHKNISKTAAWKRAVELLDLVGIPDPTRRANAFPHEFSGGMAQRVMIAIALAGDPQLLIADEPTTALDVTIQAQILDLILRLREEIGMAVILITHNLGIVAEVADRVAVMYAGRIVELTDADTLFDKPLHPYTRGLMGCIPIPGEMRDRLNVIPGNVPNLIESPSGCIFSPRCVNCMERQLEVCHKVVPNLLPVQDTHHVRCWLYHDNEAYSHHAPIEMFPG